MFPSIQLAHMLSGVASGMNYLASKNYVHRVRARDVQCLAVKFSRLSQTFCIRKQTPVYTILSIPLGHRTWRPATYWSTRVSSARSPTLVYRAKLNHAAMPLIPPRQVNKIRTAKKCILSTLFHTLFPHYTLFPSLPLIILFFPPFSSISPHYTLFFSIFLHFPSLYSFFPHSPSFFLIFLHFLPFPFIILFFPSFSFIFLHCTFFPSLCSLQRVLLME